MVFMRVLALCLCLVALSAQGALAGPRLDIDNDGGGRFSGHASQDFTPDQLRAQVAARICGGAAPRQFDLRVMSGFWLFSGQC